MAKFHAKSLTAIAVANARCPRNQRRIEIADGGCRGLYLIVQSSGHKSWACRYRLRGGLSRKLTLGSVLVGESEPADVAPELDTPLSLVAARELTTRALRQAKAGADPASAKKAQRNAARAARADSLEAVCDEYLQLVQIEAPMRSIDQRRADLQLICKSLGALPIDKIERENFVHQLDNISKTRGPVRADRVLMAAKRLLKWYSGRRSNYISVLANVERRTKIKERARKRVLSNDELRHVWLVAEKFPAPFGPYLRFILLTAARRSEAGGLHRSELLDPATWVIPWQRYKTGGKSKTDMLVPLSKAAAAIVASQPDEFVFGGKRPLGNFTRHKEAFDAVCDVTENWTIHDLRRTARTILSRLTSPDTAERCLGHSLGGIRSTYDLHSYEVEKREAFEKLAAQIEIIVRPPPAATVTDLADRRRKRSGLISQRG
jgi:integrase